jgi:hypothetical protein
MKAAKKERTIKYHIVEHICAFTYLSVVSYSTSYRLFC